MLRILCNPDLLRISAAILLFRKAQGKCHFERESPFDRFSSLFLGCICTFEVFILVFLYFVILYLQFFNSSLRKAQGKCHFERGSPYVWSILDRILKSIGKCHYHKHKHQPAKYQQKWDTKSKCFFVAAMNLTWAEFLFWQLFKKLRWTQKPRVHIRIYLRPCVNNILKNLFPVKLERTCFCQNSGKIPLKSPSKYHKCPIVHSKTYMKGNAKHHDMV